MRHDFADGKYTVINDDGLLTALRNGEPWGRDLVGDNLVYWMLVEVDRLKAAAAVLMIDLKHTAYDALQRAASESNWIPPEYWANDWLRDCEAFLRDRTAPPIDMVLHCPACGRQHIDAPDDPRNVMTADGMEEVYDWVNPPHRSHLCHGCGHTWRPADVCTNGVEAVATVGKNDSPIAVPAGKG